ncbi:PucR family transcriptional regulator [Jatrophihabitans sp. YIM 134969]
MVTRRGQTVGDDVLTAVAAGAAQDSGQVPVALLGDFLPEVVAAVASGAALDARQMKTYQSLGAQAARQGVALRALLDLYLSACWRLWRHLPAVTRAADDPDAVVVAGEVMLHAADDAVAALAEGYQLARRALVRAQESTRREFVDDLLSGTADVTGLLARAGGFGLDLTGPHAVALVTADVELRDDLPVIGAVQRAVQGRRGDAEVLVATKEGRLVVVFAAPDRAGVDHVVDRIVTTLGPRPGEEDDRVRLSRRMRLGTWQVTLGRSGIGAEGVATSYREARAGRDIAERIGLTVPVVEARDLLVHQLLLRDRPAIVDLVATLLTPLLEARGGAEPLLDTLAAYFDAGGNAALTARELHLSVRAVTYRLARVHELTGHDPADPAERFGLQAAVLGARLLDWPTTPLR